MYGYIGSMRTHPGRRDEVVALLVRDIGALGALGCRSYVVGACTRDRDRIWVTEVWESAEHHAAALRLPETRAAIAEVLPMLTGEFTGDEFAVAEGSTRR